jgi:hypothetical protein
MAFAERREELYWGIFSTPRIPLTSPRMKYQVYTFDKI